MATLELTWQDLDTGETATESRTVSDGDDIAAFRFKDTPDRVERLVGIGGRQVVPGPPVESRDSSSRLRPTSSRTTGTQSGSPLPSLSA